MTMLSADMRTANQIWAIIKDPKKIYSKAEILGALATQGVYRSRYIFNNINVRRMLEDKAQAKKLALVIDQGCVFVTTNEWQILHRTVRQLRYLITFGESIGHDGRGIDQLLASADPISKEMGKLAMTAGVNATMMRTQLNAAEKAIALTFEAGRMAAKSQFVKARAKAIAS